MNGRRSVTMASCRRPVAAGEIFHAATLLVYDSIDVPCCLRVSLLKASQLTLPSRPPQPASVEQCPNGSGILRRYQGSIRK